MCITTLEPAHKRSSLKPQLDSGILSFLFFALTTVVASFFFAQVIDIKIRYSYSSLFPSDNGIDNDTAYPFISIEQTIRVENA